MTIINCIKQVRDLDIVLKDDWIVEADLSINIDYANLIMNTFDETSLELMLRLSCEHAIKTKVITLGHHQSESILRKALAVGVDDAVRLEVQDHLEFKPEQVAYYLNTYIKGLLKENTDIEMVMCGRQADNGSHGQTGQLLAEMLGWPCITMVTDIQKTNDGYKISRLIENGLEHLYVHQPVVVTVTQTENKPLRMATLKNTLEAKKKVIEVVPCKLVDETIKNEPYELLKLTINKPVKHCVFLEDNKIQSKADQLITYLNTYLKEEVVL